MFRHSRTFPQSLFTLVLLTVLICNTVGLSSHQAYAFDFFGESSEFSALGNEFELAPVDSFVSSTQTCPIFGHILSVGSKDSTTNNEVSLLQTYLKQDPSLYPEGEVTGYYGKATERAVQRFQTRHGIVTSGTPDTTGYGMVGRGTRAKITQLCGTVSLIPSTSGAFLSAGTSSTPDTIAPTVYITAPTSKTVSGNTDVYASVTDNVRAIAVQFKLDGVDLQAEDTTLPHMVTWDTTTVANGSHTLTAVAKDAAGNTKTSAPRTVTVFNAVPLPPTCTLTAPTSVPLSGAFTLSWTTANTPTSVSLKRGRTILSSTLTSSTGSLNTTAPATAGTYSYTMTVTNAGGTDTCVRSVAVGVAPDTIAPTVYITAPTSKTVSGNTDVYASVTDNVRAIAVQFKLDGVDLQAEDTTLPHMVTWDTTTVANGSHTLTAVAKDAAGNTKTSAPRTVTVANKNDNNTGAGALDTIAPSVTITAPRSRTVSSTTAVFASVTDNVRVIGVQFKLDGANLQAEDTTLPFNVAWNTNSVPNGRHTLTAVARDAAGNTKTSAPRTVTVLNGILSTSPEQLSATELKSLETSCSLVTRLSGFGIKASDANTKFYKATDFGVIANDGKDDYEALQALSMAVSASTVAGKKVLLFPSGTIDIMQHRVTDGFEKNQIEDVVFSDLKQFAFMGCNTKFDVQGDILFTADYIHPINGHTYTYIKQVSPFTIRNSQNIYMSGFEIDGNIDQSPGRLQTAESHSHAVVFDGVNTASVKDVFVHHFAGDGMYIFGLKGVGSQNIIIDHLVSKNNGRLGLTISGAKNVLVKKSEFSLNGFTDGKYLGSSPASGVDIEPNGGGWKAENIIFDDCDFKNNKVSAFLAGIRDETINVTVKNSRIENSDVSKYGIILSVKGGVLSNNIINLKNGYISPYIEREGKTKLGIVSTLIQNNTISGSGSGIMTYHLKSNRPEDVPSIIIDGNTFIGTHTAASYKFPYLIGDAVAQFSNNTVKYNGENRLNRGLGYINAKKLFGNNFSMSNTDGVKFIVDATDTALPGINNVASTNITLR